MSICTEKSHHNEKSVEKDRILQYFDSMNKMIRMEFKFYGNVQGVGFRYTSKYLASSFNITGWVQNEWDGTVLMQAQGIPKNIELLLSKLENSRFILIEKIDKKEIPLEEGNICFEIRASGKK